MKKRNKEAEYKLSHICTDSQYGKWIAIGTRREWVEIRITPTGLMRVSAPRKDKHPYFTINDHAKK